MKIKKKNSRFHVMTAGSTLALLLVGACTSHMPVEERSALRKETLGLEPSELLDYENIDHLVFQYEHATRYERDVSAASVALARESMAKEGVLFDRVQYEEAIDSYPTPSIVLAFGDGFLRIAQHYLDKENPDLSAPIGAHDVRWRFEGAAFYYDLALRFADRVNKPFNARDHQAIEAAIACIGEALKNPRYNIEYRCETVK